jgi:hypothetical protein
MMGQDSSQLDFSTAVPFNPAPQQQSQPQTQAQPRAQAQPQQQAQPQSQAQPTQPSPASELDFSTAVPLNPPQDTSLQIQPDDGFLTKAGKWIGGTFQGIGQGVLGTATDVADLADRWTGMQPGAVSQFLHENNGQDDPTNGAPQQLGRLLEYPMEFLTGDEVLKGLSVADKLAKVAKVAKLIEEMPVAAKFLTGGAGDIARLATVGGAQGYVHGGGLGGVAGGITGGVYGALGAANGEANNRDARVVADMSPEDAQNPVEVSVNQKADRFDIPKGSSATSPEAIEQVRGHAQDAYHAGLRNAAEQAARESVEAAPVQAEAAPASAPGAEPLSAEDERVASYIRNSKGQVGDQPVGQAAAQASAPVEEAPRGVDPDPAFRFQEPQSQSPAFDYTQPINPGPAYAAPDPVYSESFGRREGDIPAHPTGLVPRQVAREGEVLSPRVLSDPADNYGYFKDGGFVGDGRGVTDDNGVEYLAANKVNLAQEPRYQRDLELVRQGEMDNAELLKKVKSGFYDKPDAASSKLLSLVPKSTTPTLSPEEMAMLRGKAPVGNLAKGLATEAPAAAPAAAKPVVAPTDAAAETPLPPNTPAEPFSYEHPKTMRDVFGKAARTVLGQAKGSFQALDDASGGRWQRFNDQIENVQNKMDEVSGIDDEAYNNLEQKRAQLEANQAKMIESMKAAGQVDPAIADRAQALYRKGMALQDLNKAVQMSTERQAVPGSTMLEKVNPTKLSLRLQKLNDTPLDGGASRLEQAVGKGGAQNLIMQTDWTNMVQSAPALPSTGKAALRELVRNNTRSTTTGVKTDWNGVLKDLDGMGSERQLEAFKDKLPVVRKGVQSRARMQKILPLVGKYMGLGTAFGGGDMLLHAALGLINGDKKS